MPTKQERHAHAEHSEIRKDELYRTETVAGLQQDELAIEARGRNASDMPKGYFYSRYFLGSYIVSERFALSMVAAHTMLGNLDELHHSEWLLRSRGSSSRCYQRGYRS